MNKILKLVHIIFLIGITNANYHGPYLLWGPSKLNHIHLPALNAIDEKSLTLMYSEAKAIILFVRNGTSKLNKENFPSFSELISKNKWAYFPQEYLPAKPVDYNSNVEVITLVGPASQQDIELGALFRDTESVYGVGKVLGILSNQAEDGHFMYKRQVKTEDNEPNLNDKNEPNDKIEPNDNAELNVNDAENDKNDNQELESANQKNEDAEKKDDVDEKKYSEIKYSDYTLLYRKGNAILYTKSIPKLSLDTISGSISINLTNKIAESETWDVKGIFSVKFATDEGAILLRFNFPLNNGYWYLTSVDVEILSKGEKVSLPLVSTIPSAPRHFSYKCANAELLFKNSSSTLRITDFQLQAHLADEQSKFSEAYDCIGFMSAPIWSGILVSALLIFVTFIGILALMSIKTPNRFESSRNKQLTFTVQE